MVVLSYSVLLLSRDGLELPSQMRHWNHRSHNWGMICRGRKPHSLQAFVRFVPQFRSVILKLYYALESQILMGPKRRISDSVSLGEGLGTCISNKFSVDDDDAGLETHFENLWPRTFYYSSSPSG